MQYICNTCPHKCNIVRNNIVGNGFCAMPALPIVARAAKHYWEEPCISGTNGSGTIFFSGCTLKCCFCQNYSISSENFGKQISIENLAKIFEKLQNDGAHNINLVSATQFVPAIIDAFKMFRPSIPVVYNCGGYESVETIKSLSEYVDIWLPDLKYSSNELGKKYSKVSNYFDIASKAIKTMSQITPENIIDDNGIMQKGLIIRHLILPGNTKNSINVLKWIKSEMPQGIMVSLMSQYTPCGNISQFNELQRRITRREYDKVLNTLFELGLETGFVQDLSSAKEEYIPPFDLTGVI